MGWRMRSGGDLGQGLLGGRERLRLGRDLFGGVPDSRTDGSDGLGAPSGVELAVVVRGVEVDVGVLVLPAGGVEEHPEDGRGERLPLVRREAGTELVVGLVGREDASDLLPLAADEVGDGLRVAALRLRVHLLKRVAQEVRGEGEREDARGEVDEAASG